MKEPTVDQIKLRHDLQEDFSYLNGLRLVSDVTFMDALDDVDLKDKIIDKLKKAKTDPEMLKQKPMLAGPVNRIITALINAHPVDLGGRRSRRKRSNKRRKRRSRRSRR